MPSAPTGATATRTVSIYASSGKRLRSMEESAHLPSRTAATNSSWLRQQDGSLSISSLLRRASATPSSGSERTGGNDSSIPAANLARSDSGSFLARASISVSVTMRRTCSRSRLESSRLTLRPVRDRQHEPPSPTGEQAPFEAGRRRFGCGRVRVMVSKRCHFSFE